MYDKLIELFIEQNNKVNLSSIKGKDQIMIKHIQDSLVWLKSIEKILSNNMKNKKLNIVDIWTWSWFPLLPLAINKPNRNFIWIESRNKKVKAINNIINSLWLKNVEVIWSRFENYNEMKFDIITARAVAYIDKLIKYSIHLIAKNWLFVLYKIDSKEEFSDLLKVSKKYKLELVTKKKYKLFESDIDRVIYILKYKCC